MRGGRESVYIEPFLPLPLPFFSISFRLSINPKKAGMARPARMTGQTLPARVVMAAAVSRPFDGRAGPQDLPKGWQRWQQLTLRLELFYSATRGPTKVFSRTWLKFWPAGTGQKGPPKYRMRHQENTRNSQAGNFQARLKCHATIYTFSIHASKSWLEFIGRVMNFSILQYYFFPKGLTKCRRYRKAAMFVCKGTVTPPSSTLPSLPLPFGRGKQRGGAVPVPFHGVST